MSKPTVKRAKPGRPATGITKVKPTLTLDEKLVTKARKVAFKNGTSFSAWVENAIRMNLEEVAR